MMEYSIRRNTVDIFVFWAESSCVSLFGMLPIFFFLLVFHLVFTGGVIG